MSTNCLVTKTKGTVNNDNLPVFGILRLVIDDATNARFMIEYPSSRKVTSNDVEAGSGVSVDFSNANDPKVSGTGVLKVKDKYNITTLGLFINTPAVKVDLSELEYLALTGVSVNCPECIAEELGDLSVLPATLTTLTIMSKTTYQNYLKGDIADMGSKFVNLSSFNLKDNKSITGKMQDIATLFPVLNNMGDVTGLIGITGSIEDFVHVRRTQGVTSGSVSISFGNYSGITFNGEKMTAGGTSFSWTASTITYNGVTIDV
jgi:hypothetical protein